jgi:hypothetical protein
VIASGTVTTVGTVTTAGTVGSVAIGPMTATAWMQLGTMQAFDLTFKKNLVRT